MHSLASGRAFRRASAIGLPQFLDTVAARSLALHRLADLFSLLFEHLLDGVVPGALLDNVRPVGRVLTGHTELTADLLLVSGKARAIDVVTQTLDFLGFLAERVSGWRSPFRRVSSAYGRAARSFSTGRFCAIQGNSCS